MGTLYRYLAIFYFYLPKALLLSIAIFVLLVFSGFFTDTYSNNQRGIILFLLLAYIGIPYLMKRIKKLSIYVTDERNAFLLGLAGFFFIATCLQFMKYGPYTAEGALSILIGSGVLLFTIALVKKTTEKIKRQMQNIQN